MPACFKGSVTYCVTWLVQVKKPNGQEYAPDTIYYLCLGIQQYLIENGRVENIFSDPYYEKFTDCLDEVAKHFSNLYCDARKYHLGYSKLPFLMSVKCFV